MYYLKHRPQTIEEIDNEQIRSKIKSVIIPGNTPHAILFSGPKGVGKTSTARITAKIVNCEKNIFADKKNKNIEPCNNCSNCKAITAGTMVDVIEIDGASARKIDDIREIIKNARFSPVVGRYKIYIIDEVHMLTREAFNALLKTLEEPPKSTIFILATTEPEKLPSTIISRCIIFNYTPATTREIMRMLERIVLAENIKTDEKTLLTIANFCDRSFRDAAKILDEAVQLNSLSPKTIKNIVGLGQADNKILSSLSKNDLSLTLRLTDEYAQSGANFKPLIEYMLMQLHAHLLYKCKVNADQKNNFSFTLRQTSCLIKLLTQAYTNLKYSPIQSLPLEIALTDYLLTQNQVEEK